jgi:hypothetical protein
VARADLVVDSELEIAQFMAVYPALQRMDVIRAIVWCGPQRVEVQRELKRIHDERVRKMAASTARMVTS